MSESEVPTSAEVLEAKLAQASDYPHELEKAVDLEIQQIAKNKQAEAEEKYAASGEKFEEPEPGSDEEKKWKNNYRDCVKFNGSVLGTGPTGMYERHGVDTAESFGNSITSEDTSPEMEEAVGKVLNKVELFKEHKDEKKSTESGGMADEADCMFCSLKHVSTAYALWNEFQTNPEYKLEFVMALGELRAAELHLVSKHPDECRLVRELRLTVEQGEHVFDEFRQVLIAIAAKAEIFA